MNKVLGGILLLAAKIVSAGTEYPELPLKIGTETSEEKVERLSWWTHDRFGMFVHFGLYSLAARHEWLQCRDYIEPKEYESRYLSRFDPDLFDAKEWVRTAKAAGMKYIVLTTKHHEGFCLWDTKTTDFKITKTPFGRDLVREYVEACREAGVRVGFYFSIKDWHHPDYIIDATHPLRPRNQADWTEARFADLNKGRDWNRYREYMYDQIRELLTEYGKIDIIWFDYTLKHKFGKTYRDWDSVRLVRMTRELQPGIIIDSRLDLMDTDDGWDFVTPEQFKVQKWPTVRGVRVPWETCQTFSGSWGYYRDEATWKSVPQLIELLTETVSKGGNLILNVGPTARGEFDERANARLKGLSKWMRVNSRSVYGCTEAPAGFVAPNGTALTYNPEKNCLYLHLYDYPMGRIPLVFWDKIKYAQFLHDASELKIVPPPEHHNQSGEDEGAQGGLIVPIVKPSVDVPVIEMFL